MDTDEHGLKNVSPKHESSEPSYHEAAAATRLRCVHFGGSLQPEVTRPLDSSESNKQKRVYKVSGAFFVRQSSRILGHRTRNQPNCRCHQHQRSHSWSISERVVGLLCI